MAWVFSPPMVWPLGEGWVGGMSRNLYHQVEVHLVFFSGKGEFRVEECEEVS